MIFILFLKHNIRFDLTNRWHPQVKLNGPEPAQLSPAHQWGLDPEPFWGLRILGLAITPGCNNYDDFQHLSFIFSPKFFIKIFKWLFNHETHLKVMYLNFEPLIPHTFPVSLSIQHYSLFYNHNLTLWGVTWLWLPNYGFLDMAKFFTRYRSEVWAPKAITMFKPNPPTPIELGVSFH
jgi:hypothetical protein